MIEDELDREEDESADLPALPEHLPVLLGLLRGEPDLGRNHDKLRAEALAAFLANWESEHGTLTPAEIAKAERELGLRPADDAAAWR
jgi:hypothetical protein